MIHNNFTSQLCNTAPRRSLRLIAALLPACAAIAAWAQTPLSLEECRTMALANNKEILIKAEELRAADYQKKQAFAAYLPALDFAGAYLYNQKDISIFDSDQMLPIKNFDLATQSYQYALVTNPMTGRPITTPDGTPVPQQVALIPKEAMTFDMNNVFFGAVTLTQPLFMGGKIRAMNKLAEAGRDIAADMAENARREVIYNVDAAYWTVVSLQAKHELAKSYVNLLDTLDNNVKLMLDQGVATRSDLLSVDVKLNEASVDLLKVENGLTLSRMALAQLCGMPLDASFTLADEGHTSPTATVADAFRAVDMEDVYASRPDLRALSDATSAMDAKQKVAMSDMLPNVALVGAYTFSNPNMFDGFKKRFNGQFSVGVMVKVPLWHWGGNYYKYRAASTAHTIAQLKLEDARQKVELQVTQAASKARETARTYMATQSNLEKAKENLRTATIGFAEGFITTENVMAAQTAWLKANSENIDAMIDMQLAQVYLQQVTGADMQ